MTEEEVKAFCDRYMPSYEAYMSNLSRDGIEGVARENTLTFKLRQDRQPYVAQPDESKDAEALIQKMDLEHVYSYL